MMSSISPTTVSQYDVTWRKWWIFCASREWNPFELSYRLIVEFLCDLFSSGASAGTINSSRSALALALSPDLGQQPIIRRFCKGVYNLRPSAPRYGSTWDPSNVLTYLSTLSPNEDISLEQLSMKLITLFALVTAHRMQTFSLIQVQNIARKPSGMEIKIPSRIKTSGKGRLQPVLVLPYFQQNPSVCIGLALSCYLLRTADLRSGDRLFVSYKRPHSTVSSQTLSRWVKRVLNASGIDTTQFSAHSTRHAVTSAALRAGVSLDVIRNTAGWTSNSETFARFYNRPLVESQTFALSILNSAK